MIDLVDVLEVLAGELALAAAAGATLLIILRSRRRALWLTAIALAATAAVIAWFLVKRDPGKKR